MATTYLSKTFGSNGDRTKWTYSAWIKRGVLGTSTSLIGAILDGTNQEHIYFSSDKIHWWIYTADAYEGRLATNRLFRDVSSWYHLVFRYDSSNSTAGDRMRMYVNGVEETSFEYDVNPDADTESWINSTNPQQIGASGTGGSPFEGEMAHVHFADGQSYAPTVFGETDTTSGIWIAKTSPSVTYGDNGYFLKFASGASGTDSSGEGNNFTVSGNLTNNKDNPDNNFCALNPLDNYYVSITYSNSNTTATSSTPYGYSRATIGLATGKWYWEVKATTISAPDYITGIASTMSTSATVWPGQNAGSYGYNATDGKIYNSASGSAYGNTYSAGNIIGVYLDLDNSKLYFAINGTLQNSGTGHSITAVGSTDDGVYAPTAGVWTATTGTVADFNFGNGYFGTTAVTSAEADAGGIGAFEYDPSSGTFDGSSKDFRAICTNNIATYG